MFTVGFLWMKDNISIEMLNVKINSNYEIFKQEHYLKVTETYQFYIAPILPAKLLTKMNGSLQTLTKSGNIR